MGTIEIYYWLKKQRDKGIKTYFSPKEVFFGMVKDKILNKESNAFRNGNISVCLAKLEADGYLQVTVTGKWCDFQRRYRIKTETKSKSNTNI